MLWLILEALGAGALLVFIVWWTMFSGRRGGEKPPAEDAGVAGAQAEGTGSGDTAGDRRSPPG